MEEQIVLHTSALLHPTDNNSAFVLLEAAGPIFGSVVCYYILPIV